MQVQFIADHAAHTHPEDYVKLVFQALMGVGHAAPDLTHATDWIREEIKSLPCRQTPKDEQISPDWFRVHLDNWKNHPEVLARLMILSAALPVPHVRKDLLSLCETADLSAFSFTRDELLTVAHRIADDDHVLPSHSDEYRRHYQPHYRLIHRRYDRLIPVLKAVFSIDKPRVFIGIDGLCASGKTTIAKDLSEVLNAPIIHMDDFFTPFEMKTPERLSLPGGNAHTERFACEVAQPLMQSGAAVYRPWDCHTGDYLPQVSVGPAKVTIIEGSYSLHPDNQMTYDVRVFIHADMETRLQRIRQRDGEDAMPSFLTRWIPMENHYFSHFRLPDAECILIEG